MTEDDDLPGLLHSLVERFAMKHQRYPHELRLLPRVYRVWRNAGGGDALVMHADGWEVPIRCVERLPGTVCALAPL